MHRFLTEPDSIQNDTVTITGDDAKHMLQVLRFQKGDTFFVFDGTGLQYEVELITIEKNKATGRILRSSDPQTEPKKKVILFQGIPKADKMEWIIQKTVEMGIWKIVPVITRYSVMQIKDKSLDGKMERWNKISREACKQSGRVMVPEVVKPVELIDALQMWKSIENQGSPRSAFSVFCYENEGKKCLKDLFKCYNIDCVNTIGIFIGPEGGFSDEELQLVKDHQVDPVSLGRRILRTETAAVTVASVTLYEMGEFGI